MIGVAFLAGFLLVFNIAMWLVLLAKFKKFFTTDEIIETTRKEMNNMIADVDRHTNHDISLIEQHLRELKAVIAEADRHVVVAKNELARQAGAKEFAVRLAQKNKQPVAQTRTTPPSRAAERYRQEMNGAKRTRSEQVAPAVTQGDLFASSDDVISPDLQAPNMFTVERDGTSYASVPVIGPEVTFADEPIVPKKDFSTQVRDLYDRGNSVEQIATELGRSTTEVQFALDMGA